MTTRTSKYSFRSCRALLLAGVLIGVALRPPSAPAADRMQLYSVFGSKYWSGQFSVSRHFMERDRLAENPYFRIRAEQGDENYDYDPVPTDYRWNLGYGVTRVGYEQTEIADLTHSFAAGLGWEMTSRLDSTLDFLVDSTPSQSYLAGTVRIGATLLIPLTEPREPEGVLDEERLLPEHKKHVSGYLHPYDLSTRDEGADIGIPDGPTLTASVWVSTTAHTVETSVDSDETSKTEQQSVGVQVYVNPTPVLSIGTSFEYARYSRDLNDFLTGALWTRQSARGAKRFGATLSGFPHWRAGLDGYFAFGRMWSASIGGLYTQFRIEQPSLITIVGSLTRFVGDHWGVTAGGDYSVSSGGGVASGSLTLDYYF